MFFTKAGSYVAWLGVVLGVFTMLTGYEVSWNGTASLFADFLPIDTARKAAVQSRVFINQGSIAIFCGLVLGVLTEISYSLAARVDKEE